jgi:hypothetical protein
MSASIRRVEYFYATVKDAPGEGYHFLSQLATGRVNLLAFSAVPIGPAHTQLVLFPENADQLKRVAGDAGLILTGPFCAILIQGDDKLGAWADVHAKLYNAKVNVYASNGVTDGRGSYGYILYVRPEEIEVATDALGI